MRIAVDATSLRKDRLTGIERVTLSVLRHLIPIRRDWDWHVILRAASGFATEVPSNAHVHELPAVGRLTREQLSLPARLRRIEPQLAYFPAFPPPLWRATNAKLVINIHDAAYWLYPHTLSTGARRVYRPLLSYHLRRDAISAVITDSKSAAQDLRGLLPPRQTIVGIPLGVAVSRDDDSLGRPVNLVGDRPYILTVGTQEPRKNLQTLVDAYSQLAADGHPSHDLVVVGRRGWGATLVVPDNVREQIRFLDHISDRSLQALYRHATIFVMPSLYEGFGLPLLEAMAASTHCIASDIPVFREVGGSSITFVPPKEPQAWAQAIRRLLSEPDDALSRSAANMRRRVEQLTWDNWAEGIAETLEMCVTERP